MNNEIIYDDDISFNIKQFLSDISNANNPEELFELSSTYNKEYMELKQYYEDSISINVRKCFQYVELYNNINSKKDMNILDYNQKLNEIKKNHELFYNEILTKYSQTKNLNKKIDYLNKIIQKKYIILYGLQEFNENMINEPEFYINI